MSRSTVLSPHETSTGPTEEHVSPERVAEISAELGVGLTSALKNIGNINRQMRLLSLNARMEASRADSGVGAAFGVIARAMGELAVHTDEVTTALGEQSLRSISELEQVNFLLGTKSRGLRLSDLALTNIDLIDRNLYERSCDVRWWATDPSVVNALTTKSPESYAHASRRLGVILDSYTVYFDLVLCDTSGNVVANGRPQNYHSVGTNHAATEWFRSANATLTGAEFGFESVHESNLVDRRRVLVYSCAVRVGGEVDGPPIGVLGIVFNWDGLAQTVLERVPLSAEERRRTRLCIVDNNGCVLADTSGRQLVDTLTLPNRELLFREAKNFVFESIGGKRTCIAHARSPGFETYSTGWHSLIFYEL